jgi:hypothetical protein
MQVKILEIRDSGTMIPALCIDMNPTREDIGELVADRPADQVRERLDRHRAQQWYMRRLGYPCDGRPNIAITHLAANGTPFWNDPYGWRTDARTYPVAHNYIIDHWHELKDGDVVCVETILGERETPKVSERLDDR